MKTPCLVLNVVYPRRVRHALRGRTAVGLSLLCVGAPAHAERDRGVTPFVVGVLVESPLMVTHLVTGIANVSYAASGERAPSGWVVVGCVAGALGVIVGAYSLATDTSSSGYGALFGIPTVALGLTSVAFGVWAGTRPRGARPTTTEARVMFAPSLSLDIARREVPSLGIAVTF